MKLYRSSERSWSDGVSVSTLHSIARAAIGKDGEAKEIRDTCNRMWGCPVSPGVNDESSKANRVEEWRLKLGGKKRRMQDEAENRIDEDVPNVSTSTLLTPPTSSPTRPRKRSKRPSVLDLRILTNVPEKKPRQNLRRLASVTNTYSQPSSSQESDAKTPTQATLKIPTVVPLLCDAIRLFLQSALVHFAGEPIPSQPAWRPPAKTLFPIEQRVHSLDALLLGCRRSDPSIDRGVIFLNVDAPSKGPGETLWQRMMDEKRGNTLSTPVWIFDIRILEFECINRPLEDQIERMALCRF